MAELAKQKIKFRINAEFNSRHAQQAERHLTEFNKN